MESGAMRGMVASGRVCSPPLQHSYNTVAARDPQGPVSVTAGGPITFAAAELCRVPELLCGHAITHGARSDGSTPSRANGYFLFDQVTEACVNQSRMGPGRRTLLT